MEKQPKSKRNFILLLLRILFIIMLIISIIYIAIWYIENEQNKALQENISGAIEIEEPEGEIDLDKIEIQYKVDFERLKEINKDVVAWLKVNGTDIEYTVVKAKNNSYYLNHNFEKKYNNAGWPFADYHNKFDGTDKNIIVYGHNRKDGSMFGTIKNVLTDEWLNNEENREIIFITENKEIHYEVFSVYKIEVEDYYIQTNFKEGEFKKFAETLKQRSQEDFGIELSEDDQILTLSTCANNNQYRVVLHAKQVK